jgi:hypothetical protein
MQRATFLDEIYKTRSSRPQQRGYTDSRVGIIPHPHAPDLDGRSDRAFSGLLYVARLRSRRFTQRPPVASWHVAGRVECVSPVEETGLLPTPDSVPAPWQRGVRSPFLMKNRPNELGPVRLLARPRPKRLGTTMLRQWDTPETGCPGACPNSFPASRP